MESEEKHLKNVHLIDIIRMIAEEKERLGKRPLNITVIELCERVGKPYDEIRDELNKLCMDGLIKAVNIINYKAIKLTEYDKEV